MGTVDAWMLGCAFLALCCGAALVSSLAPAKRASRTGRSRRRISLYSFGILFVAASFGVAFRAYGMTPESPFEWALYCAMTIGGGIGVGESFYRCAEHR